MRGAQQTNFMTDYVTYLFVYIINFIGVKNI